LSTADKQHPLSSFPTVPKKRRPIYVLLSILVLTLLLILGSSFWIWHQAGGQVTTRTPTVATATPGVSPTTTPTPTPTVIVTPNSALFYETFLDNSHGWSLVSGDGLYRTLDLTANQLMLAVTKPDTPLIENVPVGNSLDNYAVSVDFKLDQYDADDSLGIYTRGDSGLDHDYRVDLNGNGTIDIAKDWLDKDYNAQNTILASPVKATNLHIHGQSNTLTVYMVNETITVLLNGYFVMQFTDSSTTNNYKSGQIALFLQHGNASQSISVSFSRVEVDMLASRYATPTPTPTSNTSS
jgi:hypothetical protein